MADNGGQNKWDLLIQQLVGRFNNTVHGFASFLIAIARLS
jgi:hypothetical protein